MALDLITTVDLGADMVKVASVRRRKDGLHLVGAGMAMLSEQDRAAEDRSAALSGVLNRVIKKNNIPVGHTVVGLAGKGTMARYLQVPMVPPWKLALLMSFEVEEQMGSGGGADQVAYDYRILRLPIADEGQFPIFLALAQIPVVDERIRIVKKGARRIDDIDLQALGAFNLFRLSPQCDEDETSLLLDIGAEETQMTLQMGSTLCFARTITFGGRQFTNRLQQGMGLLGPEAETFKIEQARILPRDEEEDFNDEETKASELCRGEARNLAGMTQSSLRFFHSTYHLHDIRPAKVYITGGGSRLQGLPEALAEALQWPVERFDPASLLTPASKEAEAVLAGDGAHHFSAAAGMAAARLSPGGFSVSLLPPRVRRKRTFWRQTVYAYYSGALALVLLSLLAVGGCPFYGGGWRQAAYYADRAQRWEQHIKQADKAHKAVNELEVENDRLADQVDALEVRARGGMELLASLEHLRRKTPPNVFFTEFNTSEIPALETEAEEEKENTTRAETRMPIGTFQTNRFLDLKGYLVGARKEEEALDKLVELRDALSDPAIFEKVTIQRRERLEGDSPIVKDAYAMHLIPNDQKRSMTPPRGVALSFILRCRIR